MRGLESAFRLPPPPHSIDTLVRAPFFAPRVEGGGVPVAKLNCAGRECPERGECRRYLVMVPNGKRVDAEGREHPYFEWASFDVERMQHGSCSAFAVLAQARPIVRR